MKKTCLFCCEPLAGKRSVEHIYPDWLQQRYGLSREGVLQTHFSETGEVLSGRHHVMAKHVYGRVCEPCNTGWMSRLETAAQDTVIKLAEGAEDFTGLTENRRFTLSRWACKTAFALHAASNYRRIVPADHFKLLHDDPSSLPPGVLVLGHLHRCSHDFAWWQSPSWDASVSDEVNEEEFRRRVENEAYKIVFSVKNLVLLVACNPFPDMWPVLMEGIHHVLYPRDRPCFIRKKSELPSSETHQVCLAVLGTLGLRVIQ